MLAGIAAFDDHAMVVVFTDQPVGRIKAEALEDLLLFHRGALSVRHGGVLSFVV